jgi:hypothetical protein
LVKAQRYRPAAAASIGMTRIIADIEKERGITAFSAIEQAVMP